MLKKNELNSTKTSEVIPVWQPLGKSTHRISVSISKELGVKVTHTGTLDPLAEGVILILTNDLRFKKSEYTECIKTYEFDICMGIATDSYDGMGFITKTCLAQEFPKFHKTSLQKHLNNLIGSYEQSVPLYSAIKYKGQQLYKYARKTLSTGVSLDFLPKKRGIIHDLEVLGVRYEPSTKIVDSVITKITSVSGDFRQEPITDAWREFSTTLDTTQNIPVISCRVSMTRGLYVRSLSQDICSQLKTCGFVYSLVRTKNGKYSKRDCYTLSDLNVVC